MDGGQCTANVKEASEEEMIQACIAELERRQKEGKLVDVRRKDNMALQNRLVKLIGRKPLFSCQLEGVMEKFLLDSGSMISLLNKGWVSSTFPSIEIRPLSDFLEEEEVSVRFTAANNTEVEMVGCVVLNFTLGEISFPVPFLVTDSELTHPIIGFNVLENVIRTGKPEDVVNLLVGSSQDMEPDNIKVMVNLVNQATEENDHLGDLRAVKSCVIPPKGSTRMRCRVKGDVKGLDLLFLCSEPCVAEWDEDLVVSESLGELVRGKTPSVNIEIRNLSDKEKFIPKNMLVGEICAVNSVLPLKLFNPSPVGENEANIAKVEVAETGSAEKWQPKADLSHLPEGQRREIEQLLFEECEVFAKNDTDIGDISEFQMSIHLTDEIPVNQSYRHLPRKLYEDVKNYLNDLIVNGWIQESSSPYASPIVCVRKKDNSLRLCVDYRKLNLKTIPDRQPIPRVQDLLDGLYGQRLFTTLDMAKAYHQGYVKDICRKYTAFSTPWALMEWLRIPFGLKGAPAAFQRYMNTALAGLLDRICLAYLDDILIYGRNFDEHRDNLRTVLRRLKEKGVKLRVDKCVFVKPEVRYLGRLVSGEGYRADPEDVKALEKFREAPKTVGEVRSLLGFLGYYRGYVRDFATKLKPVYDLLKEEKDDGDLSGKTAKKGGYNKKKAIVWGPELQKLVDDVIDTLRSPTVMAYPDFEKPFILHTDASAVGLGAVLYQKQGEDKLNRVISYASRTLSSAERNYFLHSGKLEFLALKWAVTERFSDYLGHGAQSTIYTDNNPLTYVMTSAKLNATGMRWVADLAGYNFDLKYRPGKLNGDADGLSRNPTPCDLETLERECTETCDRTVLGSILSGPVVADCYALAADVLKFPSATPNVEGSPLSPKDVQQAQMDDSDINPVYQALMLGARPNRREWQSLSERAKLLFRQWNKLKLAGGVLVRETQGTRQIVLPEKLHSLVFVELHQKMGHLGLEKVVDLARRRVFWPRMARDIDHYIRHKCPCVVSKKPNIPERAPLVPINATYPFEMVSIDYLKVDKCKGGFEYILVVTDHFTRFSQAYPTRRATGRSAADKIFNNFILQFGFPARLHHDQGREFNNQLFQQLHHLTGIKMSNTTPYHPEGDGQCERLNRTVINMLKSIPENEKGNWKDHLPKLMFAYNSTIHKATQFSPFFLLFGREPRLPIDDVFPSLSENSAPEGTADPVRNSYNAGEIGEFVRTWNNRMNQAYELANKNIGKISGYNKNKHDARAHSVEIKCGDRVVVKNLRPKGTTRAGKLASYWEPTVYEVVEKLARIPVYRIVELGTKKKPRTLHRNLLKRVNELVSVPDKPVVVKPSNAVKSLPVVHPSSVKAPSVVVQPSSAPSVPVQVNKPRRRRHSANAKGDSTSLPRKRISPSVVQYSDSSDSDSEDTVVVVHRRSILNRRVQLPLSGGRDEKRASGSVGSEKPDDVSIGDGERSSGSSVTLSQDILEDLTSDEDIPEVVEEVTEEVTSDEDIPEVVEEVTEEVTSDEEILGVVEEEVVQSQDQDVMVDSGDLDPDAVDTEGDTEGDSDPDVVDTEDDSVETGTGESVYEDVDSVMEESFHSVPDVAELDSVSDVTKLDDSLEQYEDEAELPTRRTTRDRRAPKKFEYDVLGRPGWKSWERVKRPKK